MTRAISPPSLRCLLLILLLPALISDLHAQQRRSSTSTGRVYKDRVTPHWFSNNTRFWYLNNLPGGEKEFILVDAPSGTRTAAFDHTKLAQSLSKSTGTEYPANKLPFDTVEFSDDTKSVWFSAGGKGWRCDLGTYEIREEKRAEK